MRNYGSIHFNFETNHWMVTSLEPYALMMIKRLIPKISEYSVSPFSISSTRDLCLDLDWYMQRFPLDIDKRSLDYLNLNKMSHEESLKKIDSMKSPDWKPTKLSGLINDEKLKDTQTFAVEFISTFSRCLIVDAAGSGKTYIIAGVCLDAVAKHQAPVAVVVQSHLVRQISNKLKAVTNLKINVPKPAHKKIKPADVYVFSYGGLKNWVNHFSDGYFKVAVFDEVQELRHGTSTGKGECSAILSRNAQVSVGLTATPLFGYGIEIFNTLDIIKPECLGTRSEFVRTWCKGSNEKVVTDPQAFGSFLRENNLMLCRNKYELFDNYEVPDFLKIEVDYDEKKTQEIEELAKSLAMKTLHGKKESFTASGQFDLKLRQYTGIAKAKSVAAYVRMLVESGEPVVLAGWHREVYRIWEEELRDLGIVFVTGHESPKQKDESVQSFIRGDAKVIVLSHKSGSGIDGLQHVSSTVVIGEIPWSEAIIQQIVWRVDRQGQTKPICVFMLYCNDGSDPVIMNIIDVKYSQEQGILNPDAQFDEVKLDENRIKKIAYEYLKSKGVDPENPNALPVENAA